MVIDKPVMRVTVRIIPWSAGSNVWGYHFRLPNGHHFAFPVGTREEAESGLGGKTDAAFPAKHA